MKEEIEITKKGITPEKQRMYNILFVGIVIVMLLWFLVGFLRGSNSLNYEECSEFASNAEEQSYCDKYFDHPSDLLKKQESGSLIVRGKTFHIEQSFRESDLVCFGEQVGGRLGGIPCYLPVGCHQGGGRLKTITCDDLSDNLLE